MTSLLAFSNIAPPPGEFLLDRDAKAHVAHFGANPKPWIQWRLRLWYCHAHVMSLLDWARANGHRTPLIPWSFEKKNRVPAYLFAAGAEGRARFRSAGGNVLRLLKSSK